MSQALKTKLSDLPLSQIDLSRPELFADEEILETFKRLREEDPVHYCADGQFGPFWSITRYEDIIAVDTNHKVFSSSDAFGGIQLDDNVVRPPVEGVEISAFITKDQPHHGPIRKSVQPIASPQGLDSFKDLIWERTNNVLDSLPEDEEFDWVERVSVNLTTQMLATLFDFPFEDREKLTYWSDITTATEGSDHFPGHEKRVEILLECLEYFTRLRHIRANGPPKFDFISMMARDENTKDMDDMNFLGNLLLLIVGGNDTTRNSMSASINAWNKFPEEFAKLREDPSLIDKMVAEVIRWQTPLSHMRRTALEDIELGGKLIKKGDKVVMWYYSGNHDEDVFDHPRQVRFDRENGNRHVSFGFGIHRCMGLRVAELQLRTLWQLILEKFDSIELVGEPRRLKSNFVNGYTEMKVKVKRRSS
jgi:cytochrome P450